MKPCHGVVNVNDTIHANQGLEDLASVTGLSLLDTGTLHVRN